jgi:hypothetical protein
VRPTATLEPSRPARAILPGVAKSLLYFSLRYPMFVDVWLASFGIDVETKPHALSHTTKQSSGTATSNGELRGRARAPDQSRARTLSFSARGDTTDSHGPLQRLLGAGDPAGAALYSKAELTAISAGAESQSQKPISVISMYCLVSPASSHGIGKWPWRSKRLPCIAEKDTGEEKAHVRQPGAACRKRENQREWGGFEERESTPCLPGPPLNGTGRQRADV